MQDVQPQYRLYVIGCSRLGQPPLDYDSFAAEWQEFEDHAEKLRAAEASGQTPGVDAALRARMQQRIKDDPFVKAVLIGMAEEQTE